MKSPLYFTRHVTESIGINRERRPYYRRLSQGKSETAFRLLLTLEYLMIPTSLYYDLRALFFQKNGIPLLQDEFVSMNRTPEFDPDKRVSIDYDIPAIPWKNYVRDLRAAAKTQEPDRVLKETTRMIQELSIFPQYYPMTRHLIESIHRFAWFCTDRERAASAIGYRSPRGLVFSIIGHHLLGFGFFVLIDRASAPVHREGIPMLTSELPDLLTDLPNICSPNVE